MKDLGARIDAGGQIIIPHRSKYDLGKTDFTVTMVVFTAGPGPLFLRVAPYGQGGIRLAAEAQGVLRLRTFDASGTYYETVSAPTHLYDGDYHHIAVVRSGADMQIFLDAEKLECTSSGTGTSPVDVTGSEPFRIAFDPDTALQYLGIVEDITFWSRALNRDQLIPTMFHLVKSEDPGLIGLWGMEGDLTDASPVGNTASSQGPVSFVPVCHAVWAEGVNSFSYCSIESHPSAARRTVEDQDVEHQETLHIQAGASNLHIVVVSSPEEPAFPAGVIMSVRQPDGTYLDQDQQTDQTYVKTVNGSVWQVMVTTPQQGAWVVYVTAPASVAFQVQFQTLPDKDLVATFQATLAPLYPDPPPWMATASRPAGFLCNFCCYGLIALVAIFVFVVVTLGILAFTASGPVLTAVMTALGLKAMTVAIVAVAVAGMVVPLVVESFCAHIGACDHPRINLEKLCSLDYRYDQYAYLTAHNAFCYRGWMKINYSQQFDKFSWQLDHGVDALMLDTYVYAPPGKPENVYLCHEACAGFTAYFINPESDPITLEACLKQVVAYVQAAKCRMISLIIECRTGQRKDLVTRAFDQSGAAAVAFYADRANKGWDVSKQGWPKRKWLFDNDYRLVVFSDRAAGTWGQRRPDGSGVPRDDDGLPYLWEYAVESVFGNESLDPSIVKERDGSSPLADTKKKLFILNHFPTWSLGGVVPDPFYAFTNAKSKIDTRLAKYTNAAKRLPNFLAVDYFEIPGSMGPVEVLGAINTDWAKSF